MLFNLQAFFENLDKKLNEAITITYQPKEDTIQSTAKLDLQLDGLKIVSLPTELEEKEFFWKFIILVEKSERLWMQKKNRDDRMEWWIGPV